ncbi:unnamed protein product [Mycena citricolor]|uniref:Cytochrome P450 n=1 Tax=Mycena citricolor TaxID=2018698 RepID=A0AAD2HA19_9AGAR|nr:unnamed protein product [Mycena citricolor]
MIETSVISITFSASINDPVIAAEILDKRGNDYADRPTSEMAVLSGWDRVLSSLRYGPRLREYRKLVSQVIGSKNSMAKFHSAEEWQGNMLLKRILSNPSAFRDVGTFCIELRIVMLRPLKAARTTASATILHITYGYKISEEGEDSFVSLVDGATSQFTEIMRPGAFLVEALPLLKYVPSWFPGAHFKRLAKKYDTACDMMAQTPLDYVQRQMHSGQASNSFVADLLIQPDLSLQEREDIKWSAASLYGAGSDTTVSVVTAYFLAAAKFPQIQAKAQEEMDRVVGLAAPHRAMKDDVYEGYFIPKDSVVIPNVWKFLHDPATYRDPLTFNPERFLGPDPERHPAEVGLFGYGRRICPGIRLADVSVWINIAKLVAGLTITKAKDEHGVPIEPEVGTTDGIICRPAPFTCNVEARSASVLGMVDEALASDPA